MKILPEMGKTGQRGNVSEGKRKRKKKKVLEGGWTVSARVRLPGKMFYTKGRT